MQTRAPALGSRRPHAPATLFLFLTSQLLLAGCEEKGPFGLSQERFSQVLATRNSAAILSLPESALDNPGPLGPSTWYYAARWLDSLLPAGLESPVKEEGLAGPGGAEPGPIEPGPVPVGGGDDIPPALENIGDRGGLGITAAPLPRARVRALYRLAFERCTGLLRREAGLRLVSAAADDARYSATKADQDQASALWEEVLSESQDFGDRLGPDPGVRLMRLEALDALGRDAELVREAADFASLFPSEADSDALLWFEGAAARRLGKKIWAPALSRLLVERPTSDWTAKALAFVAGLGPAQTEIGPEVLAAARMRVLVRARDYGAAYKAGLAGKSFIFSRSAPRNLVADAGKAWLYSGSSKDGLERFESAFGAWPSTSRRSAEEEASAWTAAYYRARFLRALERWPEAAELFGLTAASAPTSQDADAATWYGIDCRLRAARKAMEAKPGSKKVTEEVLKSREAGQRRAWLDMMIAASANWKDPSVFSDLADALLREGIAARDWDLVGEFARSLGPRLSPSLDARAAYVAGRAAELGLDRKPLAKGKSMAGKAVSGGAKSPGKAPASADGLADGGMDGPSILPSPAEYYLAAANRSGAPTYYRIMALRRLGTEPDMLPPTEVAPVPVSLPIQASTPGQAVLPGELEAFLKGFIDLGLTTFVLPELASRPLLEVGTVRRLASAASSKGDYASSMRIILSLSERPDWLPTRGDYELIYPRPYIDEIRGIRPRPNVPEFILYGLLRSESFFRPDIVSSAGAVGLAQLMPATAEEVARGLGMTSYDLTHPADNIRMGSSHFANLIASTGNRPMRAMFAYNAGGGRLKRWLADYPGLPDDLLLESLPIEETRQYGRNIVQAAVFYAELYYDLSGKEAVDGVLGAGAASPAN